MIDALNRKHTFHRLCKRYFFDDIFLGIRDTANNALSSVSPTGDNDMETQQGQGCLNGRSKSNDTTHNEDVTCKEKKYNKVTYSRSSKEKAKKNIEDMNKMKKNMHKNSALHNKIDLNLQQRSVHGNLNPIVRLSCICKYFAGKGATKNVLHGTCCIKVNINVTSSSSSDDDNVQTHPVSTDTNQSIVTLEAEASSSSSSACSSSSCSSVSEITSELNEQKAAKKCSKQPSERRGRPRMHHYQICHFGKHRKGTAPGPLEAYNFRSSTVVNRFSSNPPLSSYSSPQEYANIQGDESIFHGKDKALKRSKYCKQSNLKMKMRMRSSSSDGGSSSSATWRRGNRSALLVASSSRHANAMKSLLRDMSADDISQAVIHDDLVIAYGLHLFTKYANVPVGRRKRNGHIATRMRQLGRLLVHLQTINHSARPVRLADYIRPVRFKCLLRAIRDLCGFVAERCEFKKRFQAVQIGQAVRHCASIICTAAAQAGDEQRRADAESFLTLCRRQKTLQSLGEARPT